MGTSSSAFFINIGALLAAMLTMTDLTRVEVHGPAQELEKLKARLAHLNPARFALEASVTQRRK